MYQDTHDKQNVNEDLTVQWLTNFKVKCQSHRKTTPCLFISYINGRKYTHSWAVAGTNSLSKSFFIAGHPANAGLSGSGSSVSNLNLMSTSNEVKGEKPEVRQKIPVKLSSKLSVSSGGSTKDKSRKSVAGLGKVEKKTPDNLLSYSLTSLQIHRRPTWQAPRPWAAPWGTLPSPSSKVPTSSRFFPSSSVRKTAEPEQAPPPPRPVTPTRWRRLEVRGRATRYVPHLDIDCHFVP